MTIDPSTAYRLLGLCPGSTSTRSDRVSGPGAGLAPDRFPENDRLREKAAHNQRLINEAYAVLRDYRAPVTPAAHSAPAPGSVAVAPAPIRNLQHSFFTGISAVRNSLEVLWPSATYARKRRRRAPPLPWIALGVLGLLLAALAAASVWRAHLLGF
jgi:hypothetical protein